MLRTSFETRGLERGLNSDVEWLRAYWLDSFALLLASVLTTRFCCALLGVADSAYVYALLLAAIGEAIIRLDAARTGRRRPATFCDERRLDLVGAILIGTGPWPIAETGLSRLLPAIAVPQWLFAGGLWAIVTFTLCRIAVHLGGPIDRSERRSIRPLASVPPIHTASLQILRMSTAEG